MSSLHEIGSAYPSSDISPRDTDMLLYDEASSDFSDEIRTLYDDIDAYEKKKHDLQGYMDYVWRVKQLAPKDIPAITPDMFIQASESTGIEMVTPELIMAIAQAESGMGSDCIQLRKKGSTHYITKKGVTKKRKYTYYSIGNIQYSFPQCWEEGVNDIANHLVKRYRNFKERYPDTEPLVEQLLKNQGPDGYGFMKGQLNLCAPNPQAMGAYCADASKGEIVGDQTYPLFIAKVLKKITTLSTS